ncbi:MAG TPA: bifunctional [glutamate--ammonia ligase]-adenylyl-L-tyrosine phosphorylase/[glutamate--ammonia-ligase] adenylyltransferase [Gammaproteobacteria bacterium]|nr:bifunctional [glutamate--ammonia ligase]-adenylyl-L-tyrosine phosphorylase/[glutamate--ammonia-ligase] adenylyltransferase [Gammaproteobacteria bacterium]
MNRAATCPALLMPGLEAGLTQWRANGGDPARLPAAVNDSLSRVWASSAFVAESCVREPQLLDELCASGDLLSTESPGARVAAQLATRTFVSEDELMTVLRRVRRREMLRIAWRDLTGWAELAETLRDLSDLADACLEGALKPLTQWRAGRHGVARNARGVPQTLVVLALGKLGAGELNFSSDVDLIFAYPEHGASDGAKPLDNDEYFLHLGQRFKRVLDEPTADGFVFRVDLRLRPFGEAGPLAMSFNAMETYYQNHGRDWERYALIKMRPCAGDVKAGAQLLERLRPFVYRRYLDFNAFESLREMKELIRQDVARRGLEDNIKLGPGGIREIEFIAQVFQLIRGGREPPLRTRAVLLVLRHLGAENYLKPQETADLAAAYEFLRRVENRLQEWRDQQTHELPRDAEGRARLAWTMNCADWDEFAAALATHRRHVQQVFDAVVVMPRALREQQHRDSPYTSLWQGMLAREDSVTRLESAGYAEAAAVAEELGALRNSGFISGLGTRGRQRLDELMPRLLETAAATSSPTATFRRLLHVVEAIGKRSAYLALLVERPTALQHLARLVAGSNWLADLVARSPLLLDELIDPRIFSEFPTQDSLQRELETAFADIPADDLEAQMDALRQFQQAAVVRVAAADLAGQAPLMKVSDFLTWIAEQVIRKALDIAWRHMRTRHGEPQCIERGRLRRARFGVIAYGKLGGWELGYGSDLDLVFLHDSRSGEQQSNGARVLDNSEYFTRLAQRVINILSIPTASGVLYQVDTRLRPSGAAGLIVSSLDSFARYQRAQAWTWEHQALLRARPVAGDSEVGTEFEALRREVLGKPRDAQTLRREVAEMRTRMRHEHAASAGEFDLKLDAGGLTDIEFLVQYWVLANADRHPALLDWTDNIRNLEGLVAERVVTAETGEFLTDTYKAFRRIVHRTSLEGLPARIPAAEAEPRRARVRELWASTIGALPDEAPARP